MTVRTTVDWPAGMILQSQRNIGGTARDGN